MARWSALTEHLSNETADACTLTWQQLASIVGVLPASASRHRAWWSGDRPQVRAWRAAGFQLADVTMGQSVTFVREPQTASPRPEPSPAVDRHLEPEVPPHAEQGRHTNHVLLVSCSKSKLAHPAAAKELYTSPLFRRARHYAEDLGAPWFILSAEHGLVAPDEWLTPYERYLPDTPSQFRDAWGHWVVERLALLAEGDVTGMTVEVHAGSAYVEPIVDRLEAKGCHVVVPLEGLTVGARQRWYTTRQARPASTVFGDAEHGGDERRHTAEAFAELLRDGTAALSPTAFLKRGPSGLKVPGLYSWWADERGAVDLSEGLGHSIQAGMIYAGLAGATRWPSGKRSSNTLWSRIAGMHLGKRHEFSTFRRTLGAIHAQRSSSLAVDEEALTEWMKQHLRVLAAPYEDADTLGRLETQVLRVLDPPLNLQGMPPTPLRRRLTELRRQVSRKQLATE